MATPASSPSGSSSLPEILHQVSEWNEVAVYDLAGGYAHEAIVRLEQASQLLKQYMTLTAPLSLECESQSSLNGSAPHSTCRVQIPYLNDDLFYLYDCAVSYTPSPGQQPQGAMTTNTHTPTDVIFEWAVILFNLALAHHQHGKASQSKHEADASLRQALNHYKECHQLLQGLMNLHYRHHNDDILLMNLAVMNNQAQILYLQNTNTSPHAEDEEPVFQKLLAYSMHAIRSAE